MRRMILAALLVASAAPVLAQMPPPPAVQDDRRDIRDDRRDARQDRQDTRQDRGDVHQDNRDVRQDERRIDRDAAQGQYDPRAGRDLRQDERRDFQDRRDVRQDDRRDWRDGRDLRQDHRQAYRDAYRDDRRGYGPGDGYARFRGNPFYYPRGYGYRYYGVGAFLPRVFFDQRYYIGDPGFYRLPPAYAGTRWVRVGPDALLIRAYDGRVVRVIQGLFY